ncbi:MAG: zf-TFIIB domain-containing protein [Proteobacteria bacterium]|nr:zf-TFIIB domain-containing protein [Pseudomonadota bacterium]
MALDCPRCQNVTLNEIEVDEVIVDRCPGCAGIWFDYAEIGKIVGRRSEIRKIDSIVPPHETTDDSMNCPHCPDVPLRKLILETDMDRQCVVFRCVSCVGTWLNRGELREEEDPRLAEALKAYFSKVI